MSCRNLVLVALLSACSPNAPVTRSPGPATPPAPPAASPQAAPQPAVSSAPPVASAPPPAPPPCVSELQPERVLTHDVRSLSVGRAPVVAVLSEEPWMFDGKAWKQLPIPGRLAIDPAERTAMGIFFGRDDKPRLMGARWSASSDPSSSRQVYLRYREGAWQRDPKEIGRLGSGKDAGMYGVLGNDDPELVCKLGDACIIKRRTGWKTIAAGTELARTWLCNGSVYVLDSQGMSRLQDDAFVRLAWQFEGKGQESGFWADSPSAFWVAVASQDALFRFGGGTWTREASPVKGPLALWGSAASGMWVAGEDGAAHLEGGRWCRLREVAGPAGHVAGRSGEVWIGGKTGLWRISVPAS